MAQHYYALTYRDATGETATMKVFNGAVTAVSIGGYLTAIGTLRTATDALTLGQAASEQWVGDNTLISADAASNNYAQRENKLLVQYKGNTTNKRFTLTIPTIDLALLTFIPGGKDAVQITAGAVQNWVDAFEAIGRSPDDDTENVTVVGLKFVGRNI